MELGLYLDKNIKVKGKTLGSNKDIGSTFECKWIDYRVGCEICCNGNAFAFETNFEDFRNKEFLLNDIKIISNEWYEDLQLDYLYICKDKDCLPFLSDLYKKVGDLRCTKKLIFDTSLKKWTSSRSGLGSVLDSELINVVNDIEYVRICVHCMKFINILYPKFSKKCYKVSPLFVFWIYALHDYFVHNIEFISKNDQFYIENMISKNILTTYDWDMDQKNFTHFTNIKSSLSLLT